MRDMLRLTKGHDARSAPVRGCGLPPLSDPFWKRGDLAAQIFTVLSTLERERAVMAAQLAEARAPRKPPPLPPVNPNNGASPAAAARQWPPQAAPQAGAAPGTASARATEEAQRALEAEQARSREREAALQSEIDAVMLAGIEALEAKNAYTAEAERLQKQARGARHSSPDVAAAPQFARCGAMLSRPLRSRAGV
jgi:hypothetical protein